MTKLFLLFISFIITSATFAQTNDKQYYLYNIVSFEGNFTKENFKVFYDDGIEVKRLRNDSDTKVRFSTPAGALMYFISQGWEMYLSGATSQGSSFNGTGASSTSSYWILRKPCSKEVFEKAIADAVKN